MGDFFYDPFADEDLDFDTTEDEVEEESEDEEQQQVDSPYVKDGFYAGIDEDLLTEIDLDSIISDAISVGASDVHIDSNKPVYFRILGDIFPQYKYGILNGRSVQNVLFKSITNVERDDFSVNRELDASYEIRYGKDKGRRARLSAFRSFGNVCIVLRIIPNQIPTPGEIGVPKEVSEELGSLGGKLTLLAGVTGSGKSTTMASVLEESLMEHPWKLLTIENPVEYIYPVAKVKGLVTQRGIGEDCRSYVQAINSAVRNDSDIILLGEMRNQEEIDTCITLAETGHSVASTVHISEPALAVSRLTSPFPVERRQFILNSLSEHLRVVANQILVKTPDGKSRFALYSVLKFDEDYRDKFRNGDVKGIKSRMLKEERAIEFSLADAVTRGRATLEDALVHALDPMLLKELVSISYRKAV